jgi:hypothetical protein
VAARTNVLAHRKPIRIRSYVWLGHASIVCDSRPDILLDSNTCTDLPVIKDSDAIHYVGKNVEVRGPVVSVTSSPLGTAFICFGRDYPNQTFAGFIAAGSKIATDSHIATLQGKIIGISGTIELHQGKPEIKVMFTYQIKP